MDAKSKVEISPNGVTHLLLDGHCVTCGLPHDWPKHRSQAPVRVGSSRHHRGMTGRHVDTGRRVDGPVFEPKRPRFTEHGARLEGEEL